MNTNEAANQGANQGARHGTVEVLGPADSADDTVVEAFARLIPLLSSSAPIPDRARVERVLGHPGNTVFAACTPGPERRILGLLTLVHLELPTGAEARLEDVVVDGAARGLGLGRALVLAALEAAAGRGARYVDLTSSPRRVAARQLYQSLGFEPGGAVAGQVLGGLIISADLFGSTWRLCFLVNVPVGIAVLIASLRILPKDKGEPGRGLDPLGVAVLTPTVLAFVLPLVLGHDEHWPLWGWLLLGASALGLALFGHVERHLGRRGGTPIIPGRVLRHEGFAVSVGTVFLCMALVLGLMFSITLHLQGALGFSALDSGLAFAPQALAVFLVAMNWRRVPQRWFVSEVVFGFLLTAASLVGLALALRHGGTGGAARWILMTTLGFGLGFAFSPLMGLMLSRVPLRDAADASGVIATLTQIGQVTGVATIGTLFLNMDTGAPGSSAHAITVVCAASAGVALVGAFLAARIPRLGPA
jgi:GNAT superfamily N-acetyltransferase